MFPRALIVALTLAAAPALLAGQQLEVGFHERVVAVDSVAHVYWVYIPPQYTPAERWPVILFLHGRPRADVVLDARRSGLGRALQAHPDRYPAIVVFPLNPPPTIWHGTVARIAIAALEQVLTGFSTDTDRVYLTGPSMGADGTWYIAYHHPRRFAALVPLCGSLTSPRRPHGFLPADSGPPHEAVARQLRSVPTWIFHGEADSLVPVERSRQMAAALRALRAPVRYTEFPGVGHNCWDAAYSSPDLPTWLFAQRRR